jgi:hypothetical protein
MIKGYIFISFFVILTPLYGTESRINLLKSANEVVNISDNENDPIDSLPRLRVDFVSGRGIVKKMLYKNENFQSKANYGYIRNTYLGISQEINNKFQLGMEMGISHSQHNITYSGNQGGIVVSFDGILNLLQSNIGASFYRKIGYKNLFEVGGGLDIVNTYSDRFVSGYTSTFIGGSYKSEDLNGKSLRLSKSNFGFYLGVKFSPLITDRMGFIIDIRHFQKYNINSKADINQKFDFSGFLFQIGGYAYL